MGGVERANTCHMLIVCLQMTDALKHVIRRRELNVFFPENNLEYDKRLSYQNR